MLDKALRALILISAGVTVICRYVAFRKSDVLAPENVKLLNTAAIAGTVVLVICGVIYAVMLKMQEKKNKQNGGEAGTDEFGADTGTDEFGADTGTGEIADGEKDPGPENNGEKESGENK